MSPRILVPIDFGAHSDQLLRAASGFGRRCDGHLTLLYVGETALGGATVSGFQPHQSMEMLEAARQRLQQSGHALIDLALTQGKAAHEIVRFAREGSFDLIIIGEPERAKSARDSITQRVSERAPCAVWKAPFAPRLEQRPLPASAVYMS